MTEHMKKGKSRWGTGILGAYIIFIIGIMSLVFISMSQQIDLVSETYYDQGIHYQERIEALRNSASLKEKLTIENASGALILHFPRQLSPQEVVGTISLYRPDNKASDTRLEISLDSAGSQRVTTSALQKGLWRIQVDWNAGGIPYYAEQPLILQ